MWQYISFIRSSTVKNSAKDSRAHPGTGSQDRGVRALTWHRKASTASCFPWFRGESGTEAFQDAGCTTLVPDTSEHSLLMDSFKVFTWSYFYLQSFFARSKNNSDMSFSVVSHQEEVQKSNTLNPSFPLLCLFFPPKKNHHRRSSLNLYMELGLLL